MTVPPCMPMTTSADPVDAEASGEDAAEPRAAYVAPSLVEVGRVRALTFGISGMGFDSGGFFVPPS